MILFILTGAADALIESSPERSAADQRKRELELRAALLVSLPPWLTRTMLDDDSYKEGSNIIVNLFQHPLLNKQASLHPLTLVLIHYNSIVDAVALWQFHAL